MKFGETLETEKPKREWPDPDRIIRPPVMFYRGQGSWCEGVELWGEEALMFAQMRGATVLVVIGPRTQEAWTHLTLEARKREIDCVWIEMDEGDDEKLKALIPGFDLLLMILNAYQAEYWEKTIRLLLGKA